MRTGINWFIGVLLFSVAGFATFSWTHGQDPPAPSPAALPPGQAAPLVPPGSTGPDLSHLTDAQKERYLEVERSALAGAEWLCRMNGVDGAFVHGHLPALNAPMPGDDYLRQIGAAFTLARTARLFSQPRHAACATQAVLRFLDDTVVDPKDPQLRYTSRPIVIGNRLAAAGLIVLTIHELPAPQADLLEKAEQLCNYIRSRQQPDGSLSFRDVPGDARGALEDVEGTAFYPGVALYGLMRSQDQRPASWKIDVVRRALGYYQPWWRAHKSLTMVPWQTAACAEAYLRTRELAFAAFVNEMNDWVCGLQYGLDPRHPEWWGGFKGYQDGNLLPSPPQIGSAAYAEGLVEACRVARQAGDVARYDRYKAALELCLQFVIRLQYAETNAQHFAAAYRQRFLIGGFHASHEDGNLRLDYNQHAVGALVQYLRYVARG
jgi:hypothetical protein